MKSSRDANMKAQPVTQPTSTGEAAFEAMLKQVLSDEEARMHRAAKEQRMSALNRAVEAKETFERGRERLRKPLKRKAKRAAEKSRLK
ncbi:hypothetical protein [Microvirga puerhi]|uniref:Transcriptional regulator n=1 Tax=Microvirga puerhi TaxID=2876078 RepID=A0ABS7VP55_9HYPH|nr:hypothetical protein [Microvirga puerhi]MBZ6077323.1 hypothetical protein [Microvirga puerhi]